MPEGAGYFFIGTCRAIHCLSTIMSTSVLEGYTVVVHKGQNFLVPDFAVDDLRFKLSADVKRREMGADNMAQEVCWFGIFVSLSLATFLIGFLCFSREKPRQVYGVHE